MVLAIFLFSFITPKTGLFVVINLFGVLFFERVIIPVLEGSGVAGFVTFLVITGGAKSSFEITVLAMASFKLVFKLWL